MKELLRSKLYPLNLRSNLFRGSEVAFGFALGLIVAVPALVFWGIYIPGLRLTDGLLGAIVGGIIGAVAAFGGQLLVIRDNIGREERRRWLANRATGIGLFRKLLELHDSILKTRAVIMEHDAHRLVVSNKVEYKSLHNPSVLPMHVIEISAAEFSFLIENGAVELFNDAGDLNRGYANLTGLSGLYADKIYEIKHAAMSSGQAATTGRSLSGSLPSESSLLVVEAADCQALLVDLVRRLAPQAENCLSRIIALLAKKYELSIELDFRDTASPIRASELG